uniref:Ig-like domain-containing protein n=1 Tax=Scleropages formosus TaxID=113540 RepID=A0A8C9SEH1_SCLFO
MLPNPKQISTFTFAFTFIHLACAFLQSDVHLIEIQLVHYIRRIRLSILDSSFDIMFPGDTVTLTCHINGSGESLEGWNFTWSRSKQKNSTSETEHFTTGSVHVLTLTNITGDRPQAVLTQDPPFPVLFTGENVTLKCEVRKGSEWRYSWGKKNQQNLLEKLTSKYDDGHQTYRLQSVTVRDSKITHLKFTLLEKKPKANLKESAGEIYTGERITLSCTVDGDSTGWKYLWYKDTQGAVLSNTDSDRTDGSSYTISSAAPSHSGQYWCRAHRGGFYSHYKSPVCWTVTAIFTFPGVPKPVLSLQSGWTNMFLTETVTLSCDVQGISSHWVYKWYRDGQEIPISGDGDTYTIPSAARSHSGQYQCRGELPERAVTSPHSHSLLLTVYGTRFHSYFRPYAVLSLDTGWTQILTTDCLTLRCEIQGNFSGWNYIWYSDGLQLPLEYNGETFSVRFWNAFNETEYRCRGNRTEKPFYSDISNGLVTRKYGKYDFFLKSLHNIA